MKKLHLITEENNYDLEILRESAGDNRPMTMKFKGIFMVADKINGNNRIYPYEEMKPEADKFIHEMVETNRALMELEHPANADINPERASARILSLKEDNKEWLGEAVILCSDKKFGIKGTPCGDLLAALTMYGTKWGVSTRAMGEVGKGGRVYDFHLVTLDTVLNPSIGEMVNVNGNRFVNGILESKSFLCDSHGKVVEYAYDNFEKKLHHLPNSHIKERRAEYFGCAIHDFLEDIVSKKEF